MTFEMYATYREKKSQPEAWVRTMDVVRRAKLRDGVDYEQAIFTGCGSKYYLSLASAALYQELTGCIVRAVPGGELLLDPQNVLMNKKTLIVAVSQPGTTTETVKAVEKFKQEKRGKEVRLFQLFHEGSKPDFYFQKLSGG